MGRPTFSGWERAVVNSVDYTNGLANVTMLTGPTIDVPVIGHWPSVGTNVWLLEVAQGAYACMGAPAALDGSGSPGFTLPGVYLYQAAAQSTTNNVVTDISLDTILFQLGNWNVANLGGATPTVTVPVTGLYLAQYSASFATSATGARLQQVISVSGSRGVGTAIGNGQLPSNATSSNLYSGALPVLLQQGDVFKLVGRQVSGGALNTAQGLTNTYLSFICISAQG